jgi:hypothetical protein
MEILTEWLSAIGEIEKLKLFVEGYQVSSNPSSLKYVSSRFELSQND